MYWKYAIDYKFENSSRNIIVIPISYNGRINPATNSYKQLWIYKNKDNKVISRIAEYFYDASIPIKDLGNYSLKNFTGNMVVRTIEDEILGGYSYKNGKVEKAFLAPKNNPNGRGIVCEFATTYTLLWWGTCASCEDTWYTWSVSYDYICVSDEIYETGKVLGSCFTCDSPPPSDTGGTSEPPALTYDYKFNVLNECDGLTELLRAQTAQNTEMSGFITQSGKIIITPSEGNTTYTVQFATSNLRFDMFGRPLMAFVPAGDHYELTVYYYNTPGPTPSSTGTYIITGVVHTHPIESGYDYDNPSPQNIGVAESYPTLNHYILHSDDMFKFDKFGHKSTLPLICGR